ncbi:MAG TPA: hypothetical protein VFP67_13335 [Acidimicrobiia bacterium]|nr:hypothetical protein [Acidimicrobiia bacterium]
MSSFNARLRLPGSRLPLGVEVDIIHERMTVTAGERRVAEWPLERLDVKMRPDGFHIQVDGEELVLAVSDSRGFATALGVSDSTNGTSVPSMRLAAKAESNERDLAELRRRISDLARDLTSDSVTPSEVFSRWLKLLKELNRLHVEGALPNPLFHQLNTYLLDLIPEPAVTPS